MKHVALLLSLFVFRFGGQTSVVCVNTTTLGGSYSRYTQQGGGLRKGEEKRCNRFGRKLVAQNSTHQLDFVSIELKLHWSYRRN